MDLKMIIRVAFRALVRNKMRAALTMLGCGIGIPGGLVVTRYADRILFEIGPNDPATFGASIGVQINPPFLVLISPESLVAA